MLPNAHLLFFTLSHSLKKIKLLTKNINSSFYLNIAAEFVLFHSFLFYISITVVAFTVKYHHTIIFNHECIIRTGYSKMAPIYCT